MSYLYNQNDFTHGELSEEASSRSDLEIYGKSASRLRNVVVTPIGSVKRRFGTVYKSEINASGDDFFAIDFESSEENLYVLIFVNLAVLIYRNGLWVHTVVTTYTAAQIKEIDVAQSRDSLIIVHEDIKPAELVKGNTGHTDWTLSDITFKHIPSYDFNQNYDNITFSLSSLEVKNDVTLTASAAIFTADSAGATFTGLGKETGEVGFARIYSFVSTTELKVDILSPFNTEYSTGMKGSVCQLTEVLWSATKGYPSVIAFGEGRSWYGGFKALPNAIASSVINTTNDLDVGYGDPGDSIVRIIDAEKTSRVRNIVFSRDIQIFTINSEYSIFSKLKGALTPKDADVKKQSGEGSSTSVKPVFFDNQVFFIKRGNNRIYSLMFNDNSSLYDAIPISLLSQDVVESPISMATVNGDDIDPFSYLFIVNDDGTLIVYQSFKSENVSAFTLSDTDGKFRAVVSGNREVYFLVERFIDGGTKLYLEKLDWSVFTDCSITKSYGTKTSTIDGLSHLEGKIVRVIGDGYVFGEYTVSSGEIEISSEVNTAIVGINYEPLLKTLPVVISVKEGSAKYSNKKMSIVYVDYYNSVGIYIQDELIGSRELGETFPYPPIAPSSGVYEYVNFSSWSIGSYVQITQKDPLPMTIRGIGYKISAGE